MSFSAAKIRLYNSMDQRAERLARLKKWKNKEKQDLKPLKIDFKRSNRPKNPVRLDLVPKINVEPVQPTSDLLEAPDLDSFMSSFTDKSAISSCAVVPNTEIEVPSAAKDPLASQPRKKAKEVPSVDHGTIHYKPFQRCFYDPGEDVTLDVPGITLSHPLNPVTEWEKGGYPRPIIDLINKKNYQFPTPIQSVAAAAILGGKDVMAIAPTGSGKTLAFALPMLRHVQAQSFDVKADGPIALVLAPTRELCAQIYSETLAFGEVLGITICCAYGGSDIKPQIDQLVKKTTQVVIATPGRLIDLLAANHGRVLSTLKLSMVVVDEADRMFDMGFSPQIYRILDVIRPDNQTILCSATFSSSMQQLATKVLNDPVHIQVGENSKVGAHIAQKFELVDPAQKVQRLTELLDQLLQGPEQAIVFVDRQETADEIASQLIFRGFKCTSLHGGKPQSERDSSLEEFRAGNLDLLVATSIAARGIDVATVRYVVNLDPPNHLEDYVHRVGRTGRAGETGTAITFFSTGQVKQAYEVSRVAPSLPHEIQKLASEYKPEFDRHGFGGKGLNRLDYSREQNKAVALSVFANEPISIKPAWVEKTIKGEFQSTLEFNDFTPNARKQITSLGNQSRICEEYHVVLTIKGQYNKYGDKLRVLIEGGNRAAVLNAYDEFGRLLLESSQVEGGRYQV